MKEMKISKESLLAGVVLGVSIGLGLGFLGFKCLSEREADAGHANVSLAQSVSPAALAAPAIVANHSQAFFPQTGQMGETVMVTPSAVAGQGFVVPGGTWQYETTTTASGYPIYSSGAPRAVDGGWANPNWTMGANGLIQNPCVDPPSSHGRAYRAQ